jgi:4,4'-diaponeurosporenoate glycosyltransferase
MRFVYALAIVGWCAGWCVGRFRAMPSSLDPPASRTSVVIPARNEAGRLPGLLAGLDCDQLEVIVVDDSSSDATAAIARRAGAHVVEASPPPGWTGKAFACWTGAQHATGDVIVFVDADVEATTAGILAVGARAARVRGLVSVQPFHRTQRVYEQASALPNVVAAMGAGTGAPSAPQWWRRPAAYGMVLAVARSAYDAAGGHETVRGEVVEDLALARAVAATGAPVESWCGGEGLRMRMYGEGPRQLIEGWSKNLAAGAGTVPPLRLAFVVAWIAACAQACVIGVNALLGAGTVPFVVAVGCYAIFAAQAVWFAGRIGTFRRGVLLALPVLVGAFGALFALALYKTLVRRSVVWRGRRFDLGSAR